MNIITIYDREKIKGLPNNYNVITSCGTRLFSDNVKYFTPLYTHHLWCNLK